MRRLREKPLRRHAKLRIIRETIRTLVDDEQLLLWLVRAGLKRRRGRKVQAQIAVPGVSTGVYPCPL
jgi:hypothetical protein